MSSEYEGIVSHVEYRLWANPTEQTAECVVIGIVSRKPALQRRAGRLTSKGIKALLADREGEARQIVKDAYRNLEPVVHFTLEYA